LLSPTSSGGFGINKLHIKENFMSFTAILIIVIAVGSVIAGILLLKQSASKFNLTGEQQQKIKDREAQQLAKDHEQE
jgi:hypothetical protein